MRGHIRNTAIAVSNERGYDPLGLTNTLWHDQWVKTDGRSPDSLY